MVFGPTGISGRPFSFSARRIAMPKNMYATVADEIGAKGKQKTEKRKAKALDIVISHQGGETYRVPDEGLTRLSRFLILGSENGSFYQTPKKLTEENANSIRAILDNDPTAVAEIARVAMLGIALKMDPVLFALALASRSKNEQTRRLAYNQVPYVCKTASHLMSFLDFRFALGGVDKNALVGKPIKNAKSGELYGAHASSAGLRKAIARWFESKSVSDLAYQSMKYKTREGISLRDTLRISRQSKTPDPQRDAMYRYIVKGSHKPEGTINPEVDLLGMDVWKRLDAARVCSDPSASAGQVASLIRDFNLPREVVRTDLLNDVGVWTALLEDMPMTAMIRNLGTMESKGVLKADGNRVKVIERLRDVERIRKAKIHPINIYMALQTYAHGQGLRGSNNWTVNPALLDALSDAFDASFVNVVPSGKNILLAIDISGSMTAIAHEGTQSSAAQMAAVMATIILRSEPNVQVIGINESVRKLPLSGRQRPDDAAALIHKYLGGGTNLLLPLTHAPDDCDAIVLFTDSENGHNGYYSNGLAFRAAQEKFINGHPERRLVLAQMVANRYGWVRPSGKEWDNVGKQSLEIVGFDPTIGKLTSDFLSERF
jgi:60 kDa SS-A/Ro ribonucleoprotein